MALPVYKPGHCYEQAVLLLEHYTQRFGHMRFVRLFLCHGIATLAVEPFGRFGHAWVELCTNRDGNFCIDHRHPDKSIGRDRYYRHGEITPNLVRHYTLAQAYAFMLNTGGYGPWDKVIADAPHANEVINKFGG